MKITPACCRARRHASTVSIFGLLPPHSNCWMVATPVFDLVERSSRVHATVWPLALRYSLRKTASENSDRKNVRLGYRPGTNVAADDSGASPTSPCDREAAGLTALERSTQHTGVIPDRQLVDAALRHPSALQVVEHLSQINVGLDQRIC